MGLKERLLNSADLAHACQAQSCFSLVTHVWRSAVAAFGSGQKGWTSALVDSGLPGDQPLIHLGLEQILGLC